MNCISPEVSETIAPAPVPTIVCAVRLPMGLLGFEQIKDYLLISNPAEAPFKWLRVKDDRSLAFVVVEPFLVVPEYQPDIPQPDVDFLGLQRADDAVLFNIVTIHSPTHATVNLKGPIVMNRHTLVGKQVVITNTAAYSVRHPLPLSDAG